MGQAAQQGDEMALEVFRIVGRQLGRGLALLVDILNPERIVIGSIYGRQQNLLEPVALEELRREALSHSTAVCEVVPAALQESIGDLACLSVALNVLNG
ncbi:ROK family protein [Paenibacillus sp. CC-CFT747]|nr:ROK family protein [Paenibacillus sp. CC-CFT747]